ncbi:MAG: electron transport complex subunit RsxA [Symbiobacteriaceae bacterium]|nr:electron transport complex subunit RsxA [Symbiobacteriaceae bacterium]
MLSIFAILLSSILVNNFIFAQFLGICPFLGVSSKIETAVGMGVAVTFVMAMASGITWCVQVYVLDALGISYLQTVAFILIIAALVQFVEMVIRKSSPTLYTALGVYLPLITTNCAVLGVTVLNIRQEYNFLQSVLNGFGSALGFLLAIVLLAGVRERLNYSKIPKSLEGFPISIISAGLMSVAFYGFSGLFAALLSQ